MSSDRSLLGPVFAFIIWAVHLVTIYSVTATNCQLHASHVSSVGADSVTISLVGLTVIAVAVIVYHGILHWRRIGEVGGNPFRAKLTVGCDAIAGVAIAWQLFALLLVRGCA